MRYVIHGITQNDQFEIAVEIMSRHQGIDQHKFRPTIDNVFPTESQARDVVAELSSHPDLKGCPIVISEIPEE